MIHDSLTNPFQIIEAKTQQGWSGYIEVSEPKNVSISWRIYLLSGKIQYATSIAGQQERLNYLWRQFNLGSNCPTLDRDNSEYQQITQWLSQQHATEFERNFILSQFTAEALIQVFSIDRSSVKLVPNEYFKTAPCAFALDNLEIRECGDRWRQVKVCLDSPFNRLYLEPSKALQFYKTWRELYKLPELTELSNSLKLSAFVNLFTYKSTFYHIASQVNFDHLRLAEHLQSSIERQILIVLPYQAASATLSAKSTVVQRTTPLNPGGLPVKKTLPLQKAENRTNRPTIVCIDDSKTVQRQVKMTLEAIGYRILSICAPEQALKELLRQEPVLILMDINMPNINGYDLCSMLRKSNKFKDIPIVMLTGRDGAIDRMRAKFVGSTDYLTKPFIPQQLVEVVHKFHRFTAQV